jgi:lipopolysaccharide transport system permease protein
VRSLLTRAVAVSPSVVRLPVRQRTLLGQLARRDVEVRYRGSRLGLAWAIINPLLLLAVYTFVFGTIFDASWPGQEDQGIIDYALIIFCGLVTINLFNEPVTRSTTAIVAVPNYVKKVVFPLELIPISMVGSAMFHFAMSFLVLLVLTLVFAGVPSLTALAVPIFMLPVVLLGAGFCWFLASLGVFVRDLTYVVQLGVQILLFLTPVFYPDDLVPEALRPILLKANPMANAVNNMRQAMLFHGPIDWVVLGLWIVVSYGVAWLGYRWFVRTKGSFADVL